MGLEQQINEEIKAAVKSGDKIRLETVRSLRAAIIEFNKSGIGREMTPDDEIKLLNNAAKKRRDAIEMYEKAGRADLYEKERIELEVIKEFLPKQLSDDEIRSKAQSKIEEIGAKSMADMGKVMGAIMKEFAGKAEGGKVQNIVKELLGNL